MSCGERAKGGAGEGEGEEVGHVGHKVGDDAKDIFIQFWGRHSAIMSE